MWAEAVPAGPCRTFAADDTWTDQPYTDGVVLIGDAGGYNNPLIGQGLSLALRDARAVAEILLDGPAGAPGPDALAQYGADEASGYAACASSPDSKPPNSPPSARRAAICAAASAGASKPTRSCLAARSRCSSALTNSTHRYALRHSGADTWVHDHPRATVRHTASQRTRRGPRAGGRNLSPRTWLRTLW